MYTELPCGKEMYEPKTSTPGVIVQPCGVQYSPLGRPVSQAVQVPLLSVTFIQLPLLDCTNTVSVLGFAASRTIWPR
jgi:hypothetical protein